jgi:hypothetical protein
MSSLAVRSRQSSTTASIWPPRSKARPSPSAQGRLHRGRRSGRSSNISTPVSRHGAGRGPQTPDLLWSPPVSRGLWRLPTDLRSQGNSMQTLLPVARYPSGRSRRGLIKRMVIWRSQHGSVYVVAGPEVPEPVFIRFVAACHRMPGVGGMSVGVLRGRRVATADMAASGASAQMEPPAAAFLALGAARTAGGYRCIDVAHAWHPVILTATPSSRPILRKVEPHSAPLRARCSPGLDSPAW